MIYDYADPILKDGAIHNTAPPARWVGLSSSFAWQSGEKTCSQQLQAARVTCDSMKSGNIMPFPEKFRALIELREDQVTVPDYVWLSYAVCAVESDSCGWRGWIIESAWKVIGEKEVEVEADAEQGCPICRKQVYRTGIEKQFRLNTEAGPKIGYAYDSIPPTFK